MKILKNNTQIMTLLTLAILVFTVVGCKYLKTTPKDKIVGRWSGKTYDGSKNVAFNFTEGGNAITSMDSKEIGNEKYKFIDDQTLEFETPQGMKYTVKAEFSDNDNTMTMTTGTGIRTTFKRE